MLAQRSIGSFSLVSERTRWRLSANGRPLRPWIRVSCPGPGRIGKFNLRKRSRLSSLQKVSMHLPNGNYQTIYRPNAWCTHLAGIRWPRNLTPRSDCAAIGLCTKPCLHLFGRTYRIKRVKLAFRKGRPVRGDHLLAELARPADWPHIRCLVVRTFAKAAMLVDRARAVQASSLRALRQLSASALLSGRR